MTYKELITSSLRMIGRLAPGRSAGAAETADAQFVLNAMLDASNADGLNIYTDSIALYTCTPGLQIHTIGPGGTWNADRPAKIVLANLLLQTSPVIRRKLDLPDEEKWASRAVQNIAGIPREIFNDAGFPLANLYFYLIPDAAYQVELYTWQLLKQVTDLSASVSFPSGYAEFIRTNLAVNLAPEWGCKLRADVAERARVSKADVQRNNVEAPTLKTEPGLCGRGPRGGFNWISRSYR